jgi:hypothetical protein
MQPPDWYGEALLLISALILVTLAMGGVVMGVL